ncbi:MAG: UvrD-helicase domain-containing protein, partial [Burkholderiales bacterium]|nr:UvrD-helicase domain-containing protein [Burkholderiales bacterium]
LPSNSKSDYLSRLIYLFNKKNVLKYSNSKFSLIYQVLDNPDLSILTTDINELDKKDPKIDILINKMTMNLLSSIAKYIEHNFTKYYRKNNILSFDDLIDIVADGLSNNEQLANKLHSEYPVIFIDEFQDTDNRQWQIFCNILQLNADKKRGHVVVVGDPKQAIYRFRGADINVYLEARNAINNTLTLDENRRSHPQIINFINQLFNQAINPDSFGYRVYYYNLHAKVSMEKLDNLPTKNQLQDILKSKSININELNISDQPVQIITVSDKDKEKRTEKLDFMMISEILLLLNYNPALAGKTAILVTKNSQAKRIVNLLEHYGVKASLYERENIFTTTTAGDLYKILIASTNLSNTKSIRQALASNLFNIPYTELIDFIDSSSQIFAGENILERFFNYKLAITKNDILSMVYQLINDLNKIYKHYNVTLTNRNLANLIQLGELINKNCASMKSSAEMLFWFNKKIDNVNNNQPDEADIDGINEELVRLDNDELQIKVITQHKSKGLEFDILFCPEFKQHIYNFTELRHLNESNSLSKLFSVKFLTYQNTQNAKLENKLTDDENIHRLYNIEEIDEINRLNYVALTRAKSRIYIYLANFNVNKNGVEYDGRAKYEYIHKLFGLNPLDAKDDKHKLFNYPNLFKDPCNAIKYPELLPGVMVRTTNLINRD